MVTTPRRLTLLGVAAFVVGLVGFAASGWRFGGANSIAPTVLGVAVALVAVAATVRRMA